MFFHTYVLTKRGPFAKIWLAAHWDRKLTKNDVRTINLSETVVQIIEPQVPIALRTSGELMLGVVRVYGHKVRVLLKESQDVAQELLRKDAILVAIPAGGKTVVSKEVPSAVTHADVLPKDLMTSAPVGTFEAEFDDIANIVGDMEKGGATIPRVGKKDDMAENWFQPAASQFQERLVDYSQDDLLNFQAELREGKRGREESIALSERSKKSGSSIPSVEELRKSGKRSVEPDMDIGVPPPDDLEFPDMPPKSPPPPEVQATPAIEEFEPPQKKTKTHGMRMNVVDNAETAVPLETYAKAMKDRSDMLVGQRRHGPQTAEDAHRLSNLDLPAYEMSLLGEEKPWDRMHDVFVSAMRQRKPHLAATEAGRGSVPAAPNQTDFAVEMPPLPDMDMPPAPPLDDAYPPAAPDELADGRSAGRPSKRHRDETTATADATLSTLRGASNSKGVVVFRTAMKGKPRTDVARTFGDVLVLASRGQIAVRQDKPFGELYITTAVTA